MGVSGSYTPDSLSREGSPEPDVTNASSESSVEAIQPIAQTQHVTSTTLTRIPAVVNDVRYSQSAPGSPSSEYW